MLKHLWSYILYAICLLPQGVWRMWPFINRSPGSEFVRAPVKEQTSAVGPSSGLFHLLWKYLTFGSRDTAPSPFCVSDDFPLLPGPALLLSVGVYSLGSAPFPSVQAVSTPPSSSLPTSCSAPFLSFSFTPRHVYWVPTWWIAYGWRSVSICLSICSFTGSRGWAGTHSFRSQTFMTCKSWLGLCICTYVCIHTYVCVQEPSHWVVCCARSLSCVGTNLWNFVKVYGSLPRLWFPTF